VAVDHFGNLYYSEENPKNVVFKVTSTALDRHLRGSQLALFDERQTLLSQPGGVSSDGFYVFWGNKASGVERGSVVRGSAQQANNTAVDVDRNTVALSKSSNSVFGVCTTANNLFYTDADGVVWGVKKTGGKDVEISGALVKPRSCTWDGDGTVFVADMGVDNGVGQRGGAVYAFPGSMRSLGPQRMTKMVDFENAFGLAMIHAGTSKTALQVVMALMLAVWC
jgi:hypothetical protein